MVLGLSVTGRATLARSWNTRTRLESIRPLLESRAKLPLRFADYTAGLLLQDMRICSLQSVKVSRDGGGKEKLLTCYRKEEKVSKAERIPCEQF
jgi:hypothetical protein